MRTSLPNVSVIIPTWNRRDLIGRAIDSVLAQTRPVEEIIVVDDGSTDGTDRYLFERYGDRVTCVRQANAGVSSARNRGLAMARGRYLTLLDSDDVWMPEKTALQAEWLDAHPDFGMVLCDIERVESNGDLIDVLRRRDQIPEDGMVLRWLLRSPALAPLSVMFRKEVIETVGRFDESLRTAEDLDFHLRIARRWPIGVLPQTLARACRGDDGLSGLRVTNDDYVNVIERAVRDAEGLVSEDERRQALATAYVINAEGFLWWYRFGDALRLMWKAWTLDPDPSVRRSLLRLLPIAGKRAVRCLLEWRVP